MKARLIYHEKFIYADGAIRKMVLRQLPLILLRKHAMSGIHFTLVHPGEVLKDELEEICLTQSALAKHIGVLPKTINEI